MVHLQAPELCFTCPITSWAYLKIYCRAIHIIRVFIATEAQRIGSYVFVLQLTFAIGKR